MNNDSKILKALEALQADVATMKKDMATKADVSRLENTQQQQGKILVALADNMATVLAEQQQQRTDIRALHTELHDAEERQAKRLEALKAEIVAARAEAKADSMDLQATVIRRLREDEKWLEAIAEKTETPNPNKH